MLGISDSTTRTLYKNYAFEGSFYKEEDFANGNVASKIFKYWLDNLTPTWTDRQRKEKLVDVFKKFFGDGKELRELRKKFQRYV